MGSVPNTKIECIGDGGSIRIVELVVCFSVLFSARHIHQHHYFPESEVNSGKENELTCLFLNNRIKL